MIQRITLLDCLQPGDDIALDLTAIDDAVFVRLSYDETGDDKTTTVRHTREITVSLPALRQALDLLACDAAREHLRPTDPNLESGEKLPRLGGTRFVSVPV